MNGFEVIQLFRDRDCGLKRIKCVFVVTHFKTERINCTTDSFNTTTINEMYIFDKFGTLGTHLTLLEECCLRRRRSKPSSAWFRRVRGPAATQARMNAITKVFVCVFALERTRSLTRTDLPLTPLQQVLTALRL